MFQNWALPCPVRFSSLKSQLCACCSPQLCLFFVKRISIIYYPWTSSGSISKQPRTGSVLVPTRCFLVLELPKNRANKLKRIVSNSDLFIAVCFLPLLLLDILFRWLCMQFAKSAFTLLSPVRVCLLCHSDSSARCVISQFAFLRRN